jgi:hypothetical protein
LARLSVFEEVELVTKDLVFDKFFFETRVDQMQPEKAWHRLGLPSIFILESQNRSALGS